MDDKPDKKVLLDLVRTKMPFGKYAGRLLCDLPVYYLVWFKQKGGFPEGRLGELMENVLEIKTNSLGYILEDLKKIV